MGKAGQARQVFKTFGKNKKSIKVKTEEKKKNAPKLKKDITPGSVLILLAGRFRGKRVVFLKQLASGLLLVTGPYAVNGVPLRRVNQRFCVATSAKVDLKGADFGSITDAYFKREDKKGKAKKTESSFFAEGSEKTGISDEKKAEQKKMDDAIVKALPADQKAYLKARFSLSANMYPHELKF
mmetsp:Transcript_45372/g.114207  ORF Transcript_45372/g.114207 Transcript_45372/m.114207 type:complete len:182 (+) Transcript_45372:105-650(+)